MRNPDLARQILEVLRRERASVGFHIREQWLADELGVSRSPIRTALRALEQASVVRSEQKRGYFLRIGPESGAFEQIELPTPEPERLYGVIASERFAGLIDEQVSVGDLMRRYEASRGTVQKVLVRMQEDGLAEKSAGHRWTFGPALNEEDSYRESVRFRLLVEPAALWEDGFALSPSRLEALRRQHETVLTHGPSGETISTLLAIDTGFHDSLAEASGNRFLAQAIRQQTRLRRFSEVAKYDARDRLADSFREHLAVLEAIELGDMPRAASLLSGHIRNADARRPDLRKVRVLTHRRLTRR